MMAVDAPRGAGVAQRISGWSVMAGLDLRQQQKLSQQLVMTQALQQAIKLLQLNHLEMIEHVQTELLENPTLEEIPGTRVEVPTEVETRLQADSITQSKDIVEQSNGAEEGNLDWGRRLQHVKRLQVGLQRRKLRGAAADRGDALHVGEPGRSPDLAARAGRLHGR